MKFVQYCNCVSPHQLPLARELVARIGADQFRYVYIDRVLAERDAMGWKDDSADWIVPLNDNNQWVENCDVLLTGVRDIDLFARRADRGLLTLYQSERWFKPVSAGCRSCRMCLNISGRVRMVVPSYFRMAKRFVCLANSSDFLKVLPIGVHALRDMRWLGVDESKLSLWGYFVSPSKNPIRLGPRGTRSPPLKILWVGRMLRWKRVDTIIRACSYLDADKFSLTLIGDGPEKERLIGILQKFHVRANVYPSIPIEQVRRVMRGHDVYVLSSDGCEGWGAVANEALEEGMMLLGTYEAGSTGTILQSDRLFHAGDSYRLAELLDNAAKGRTGSVGIGSWSAAEGAERLLKDFAV